MKWHAPCDPGCPEYSRFADLLFNDPMTHAMGAPTGELMAWFEKRHRAKCSQCQEYGAANIEVIDG
jgi:hypothetical protein